jgi:uncharacterized metal-binding protein YceD (DUF177 family)
MAAVQPLFSIVVADLEYGDRELDEVIPLEWLETAFAGTEAKPVGKPGHLEVTVSKTGREVMVRGQARASVSMPCARTLDPVAIELTADIFLLLAPGAAPAVPSAKPRKERPKTPEKPAKPGPKVVGAKAKKREAEERLLSDDDAALDTYEGDRVVLDAFLAEFLVLELPMFVVREDLRSEATPAIERDPEPANTGGGERETVDPRLAPLAAIASRLRQKKE